MGTMKRVLVLMLLFAALVLPTHGRVDVSAPARPGEKSSRQWEKAAAAEMEDDEERAKVREMGGSDTALVNILEGDVADGKIYPVGDRTAGLAVANFTQMAMDFLKKIGREDDALAQEKMVHWFSPTKKSRRVTPRARISKAVLGTKSRWTMQCGRKCQSRATTRITTHRTWTVASGASRPCRASSAHRW